LLVAYSISGLSAGLAALVFLGRAGIGLPTEGGGLELSAIAAVVIGGASLSGAIGRPAFVLLGALFIQFLGNGLNLAGTSPFEQQIVLGLVLVAAGLIRKERNDTFTQVPQSTGRRNCRAITGSM
jgi:ribose/xylose/arabinose/galactoside ABC-type transport system permease subunit